MRKSALYMLGLVVATLVALGLVVLFSASEVRSSRALGQPWALVAKQAVYVAIGLATAFLAAAIDYRFWRDHWIVSAIFGAVVVAALWAVFLFPAVKGSHRWIPLPGFNFQPGECAKIATVLLVSVLLDKSGWRVELFGRGALAPAALIGLFALPVLLEPDFGSVMVIAVVGAMLMFVAGTRIIHMAPLALAGLGVVAWKVFHNANRMARLLSFAGVASADGAVDSAAYQGDMSVVAISRGGIFGVGLTRSMQKQNYLPEAWTDFILAVGAEEMGLVFSIVVIALFIAFFCLSVYIARKASDRLGRFIALGMAVVVFFQAMFNIGVVCEALPTKGMALPFFSYGGTNMIVTFIAVGFIFSVGIHALNAKERHISRRASAR